MQYLYVPPEVVCADVDQRLAVLETELAELPPLRLGTGGHHHDVHLHWMIIITSVTY